MALLRKKKARLRETELKLKDYPKLSDQVEIDLGLRTPRNLNLKHKDLYRGITPNVHNVTPNTKDLRANPHIIELQRRIVQLERLISEETLAKYKRAKVEQSTEKKLKKEDLKKVEQEYRDHIDNLKNQLKKMRQEAEDDLNKKTPRKFHEINKVVDQPIKIYDSNEELPPIDLQQTKEVNLSKASIEKANEYDFTKDFFSSIAKSLTIDEEKKAKLYKDIKLRETKLTEPLRLAKKDIEYKVKEINRLLEENKKLKAKNEKHEDAIKNVGAISRQLDQTREVIIHRLKKLEEIEKGSEKKRLEFENSKKDFRAIVQKEHLKEKGLSIRAIIAEKEKRIKELEEENKKAAKQLKEELKNSNLAKIKKIELENQRLKKENAQKSKQPKTIIKIVKEKAKPIIKIVKEKAKPPKPIIKIVKVKDKSVTREHAKDFHALSKRVSEMDTKVFEDFLKGKSKIKHVKVTKEEMEQKYFSLNDVKKYSKFLKGQWEKEAIIAFKAEVLFLETNLLKLKQKTKHKDEDFVIADYIIASKKYLTSLFEIIKKHYTK